MKNPIRILARLIRPLCTTTTAALILSTVSLTGTSPAVNVVTIGDSLTAEYETVPDVPGFDSLPTDYAKITVPGWESMSWVEVLGRMRGSYFNFGAVRGLTDSWGIPRFSGYEYNWGVPGVKAGQYEDFVTSSVFSNPLFFALRQPLENQLANKAQRVVIWLGGNDFRENYGRIYDGDSPATLIDGLIDDLRKIIDFVRSQTSTAQIVLANVPDLGAAPTKKESQPDPAKRSRVTAATALANTHIGQLAAQKNVALADVYSQTLLLAEGVPFFFGGVEIVNDKNADNNLRWGFARDGLHPNTCLQIVNARIMIRAFNQFYGAGIPNITDSEALAFLGIDPNQPFYDWLALHNISDKSFDGDGDGDGISQLVEFAFHLKPDVSDAAALPVKIKGSVPGFASDVSVKYRPELARAHFLTVVVQYSQDGVTWTRVPSTNVIANADGSYTAAVPRTGGQPHLRLKVVTIPPSGSGARFASFLQLR